MVFSKNWKQWQISCSPEWIPPSGIMYWVGREEAWQRLSNTLGPIHSHAERPFRERAIHLIPIPPSPPQASGSPLKRLTMWSNIKQLLHRLMKTSSQICRGGIYTMGRTRWPLWPFIPTVQWIAARSDHSSGDELHQGEQLLQESSPSECDSTHRLNALRIGVSAPCFISGQRVAG